MNKYFKIINTLNTEQRKYFFVIVFFQAIKSLLEIMSLGSIYPLIYFIFNGDVSFLDAYFNINTNDKTSVITFLLLFIIIVFFIKTIFFVFITYKEHQYLVKTTKEVQIKLFSSYLVQDYSFFLNKKNEELINNIITEASYFSKNQIQPLYLLINESLKILLIFFVILIINPFYTLISVLTFLPIIIIFIKKVRNELLKLGVLRKQNSEKMINFAFKGLNSIREILIFKNQKFFLDQFKEYCQKLNKTVFKNNLLQVIPKIFFEFLVVSYILLIFLISIKFTSNSTDETFVYLSFLSLSFVRLLPSVNSLVKSIQDLSYYGNVTEMIRKSKALNKIINFERKSRNKRIFNFKKIEVKNIKYDFNGKIIFDDTSLEIRNNLIYGVTGESGSGKTTFFNLLIGFLRPTKGQISIDGKKLNSIKNEWQNDLCYIPQDLYLFDDTIEKNITLGSDKISDIKKLNKSINISRLSELISKYSKRVKHKIKNSGIDISGGQRQRIGIARSLYIDRNTIFLDETTNALDTKTEEIILRGLRKEFQNKTVFIISHSKDLHKYVDKIINIKNNKIKIFDTNARR